MIESICHKCFHSVPYDSHDGYERDAHCSCPACFKMRRIITCAGNIQEVYQRVANISDMLSLEFNVCEHFTSFRIVKIKRGWWVFSWIEERKEKIL